ncbi:MAG: Holliday junction resolvase RuvX [Acidimicrobiales bacterium]|nr:Holliday junction resolvase RuvX [Acidimicrobiales bacterium]
MGVDLGARRIGVAVTDEARTMALPRTTLERSGDAAKDRAAVVQLAVESGAVTVVVGHPRSLDGSVGPAARAVEAEAEALAEDLAPHDIGLELFDERFTTVTAERELAAAGVRGPRRRAVVDRSAAAVLLSSWLDGAGTGSRDPGPGVTP